MDIENRFVVAKGEEGWGGKDWEFGVSRCKLLHVGQINHKALLCSTGNYIQQLVITHSGKEYGKECTYMCNWATLLYSRNSYNIVNQLYFNKIHFFKNCGFGLCERIPWAPEASFLSSLLMPPGLRPALSNSCFCPPSSQPWQDLTRFCRQSHSQSHVAQI